MSLMRCAVPTVACASIASSNQLRFSSLIQSIKVCCQIYSYNYSIVITYIIAKQGRKEGSIPDVWGGTGAVDVGQAPPHQPCPAHPATAFSRHFFSPKLPTPNQTVFSPSTFSLSLFSSLLFSSSVVDQVWRCRYPNYYY